MNAATVLYLLAVWWGFSYAVGTLLAAIGYIRNTRRSTR